MFCFDEIEGFSIHLIAAIMIILVKVIDKVIELFGSPASIAAIASIASGEFNVGEEALDERGGRDAEQSHEDGADHVAYHEDRDQGADRRVHLVREFLPVRQDQVTDACVRHRDENLSKEHEHCGNAFTHHEGARVLQHQQEGVHGGGTEVRAVQGYLHEGVLVQKFDETVATLQTASATARDELRHRVLQLLPTRTV